jgi:hypothetical protein
VVTGFNDYFHIVTTRNCSAVSNSHILQFTTVRTKYFHSAASSPVVGWWWRTFPLLWVPEISQCHSCKLLTATAYKDRTSAVLWLTNSPINSSLPCTSLHCHSYNISAWTPQKAPFLCCCSLVHIRNLLPSIRLWSHTHLATGLHTTICFFSNWKHLWVDAC